MTCRAFLFGIPIPFKPWRPAGVLHSFRALPSREPIRKGPALMGVIDPARLRGFEKTIALTTALCYALEKSLKANSERDLKSSSPLQKHQPPQEPSAQHLEKAGRGQFSLLFRAGFRCRPLPNQTNHLAGLRLAGLRDPGSHHLCMEH